MSMLTVIGKSMTLEEFRRYAETFDFGSVRPSSLVIHHTWRPTKAEWKGERSIEGLRSYYEGKGWTAGPHLFVADDGIWLFTPMNKVGIHADAGNATWTLLGKDYTGFKGPLGSKLKSCSLGIEVVGDYDLEKWSGKTRENALGVVKILTSILGIQNENVRFHRDFSSKSCPGLAITKDWLLSELSMLGSDGQTRVPATLAPSPWASEAWAWAHGLSLDNSIQPNQSVDAEWVFAILKKYHDLSNPK